MIKLVENYSDANYWYRKYSNGWIEQGGTVSKTFSTDETWVFTFPRAFTAAPLSVLGTFIAPRKSDSAGGDIGIKTNSATSTGVTFLNDNYGANKIGVYWEAKGF